MLRRAAGVLVAGLFLTFGTAMRMQVAADAVVWPEILCGILQLAVVAASFRSVTVERHLGIIQQAFCILAAGWFIYLAALAQFEPAVLVGIPTVVPALGIAFALTTERIDRTALFLTLAPAALAVVGIAAPESVPWLLIASTGTAGAVATFALAAWFGSHRRHQAAREHHRMIVDQADEGIFLLDVERNTFLHVNPAFCRMTGRTAPELTDMTPDALFSAEPGGRAPDFRSVAEMGAAVESLLRKPDGEYLPIELRAARVDRAGRGAVSVVVEDVVARREYEERLRSVKQSLDEITRFKTSLLSNMSHEVRTPLSSILGWAAVLNDELPDRQRELVCLIENSGRRLLNTLNSVIELAHLHANTMKLRPALIDANDAVASTVSGMAGVAEEKGLRLDVEPAGEPAWVCLDTRCLHRSLVHLLDNAIKFTEHGHIVVRVRTDGKQVLVVVEDTGTGIGEEFLPSIFDEFKQESAGLSRDHEGNGLGLPIARRLVEMSGGRIDVVSTRGVGSTFTISLAAASAPVVQELSFEARRYAQVS